MKTKDELKETSLFSLYELAVRSYNWISQSPDRRGAKVVEDYGNELDQDLAHFKGMGATDESITRYKDEYIKMISAWLQSQSNCASSFVCGPANFPVAKMEKRNRWADNHYQAFRTWRDKVYAGYNKRARKDAVITGGGELEIARKKLADHEATHEMMKRVNIAFKFYKGKKTLEVFPGTLTTAETETIIKFHTLNPTATKVYRGYQLTNNLSIIKHTKARIAELEVKESNVISGNKEVKIDGGKIILNYEIDRIQVQHDNAPPPEVRTLLKSSGFNWSPFHKVWQRKITDNAKHKTQQIFKVSL